MLWMFPAAAMTMAFMLIIASVILTIVVTPVIVAPVCIMSVIMVTIIPIAVTRHYLGVVPVFLYKIHGAIAGIVAIAMFFPFISMAWWHHQIHRLLDHIHPLHYAWLSINDLWLREITNIYPTIETWLPELHRHTHILRLTLTCHE
ncbi:hypothetical protein UNDYM_3498 [Undibacterium sp. YM2]|nr:hypothetical protein UNDYM_3498 [Undibacterium sp. YM2]